MDHAINSNLEDYMIIRQYEPNDCEKLANLFYNTVHAINAKDYSQQQLNVWATDKIDLEAWNKALSENYTVVAVENNIIVGLAILINQVILIDYMYTKTISVKVLQRQSAIN